MAYVFEATVGDAPVDTASEDENNTYLSKMYDSSLVQSSMLYAMEAGLQKRFEKKSAYEIITDLKAI